MNDVFETLHSLPQPFAFLPSHFSFPSYFRKHIYLIIIHACHYLYIYIYIYMLHGEGVCKLDNLFPIRLLYIMQINMFKLLNYQKYKGTSIRIGCATRSLYSSSGPEAEGVPTNNQRGRGSGPCRLWGGLDKARHIVQTALLVRVQRLRNDLYKAVKGPSTRPIVPSMTTGSYWRRRRRFTIFQPDEMKFVLSLTLLSL